MGDVYTSEKMIWRGRVDVIVDVENESLWLLLQWHALQENCNILEDAKSSAFLEMICFKIGRAGYWPKRWCQLNEVVLMLEKAISGVDGGHSYTPSLVLPFRSVTPMWRSLTTKRNDKNSMEALFEMQNLEIEIKFLVMLGTQRTSVKENCLLEWRREVEPVCVIGSPVPSPIMMSSSPLYEVWRDKLLRSEVTWWDAPLSNSHALLWGELVAKCAFGCQDEFSSPELLWLGAAAGMNL